MQKKPDSLIFDMDGTLWDALDVYVSSWNSGLKQEAIDRIVTKEEIGGMMGLDSSKVLNHILPHKTVEEQYKIYKTVNEHRAQQVLNPGGVLYSGVIDGLTKLSAHYKLFIVSNCPVGMIQLFIQFAKIEHLIIDEMAYGFNNQPKHVNINLLREKYNLESPVYIGDTDGDQKESALAEIPFVFFSFGFGKSDVYDLKFDDFESFTNYFLSLT